MSGPVQRGLNLGLSRRDATLLARLRTPEKIQDFVTALPTNFETEGETCRSVVGALRQRKAHCLEGVFVAACALMMQGEPPLVMDFQARGDDDHVIALFRRHGCWGAISKTNHVWLRWRDPIYRSPREIAISYFHEYVFDGRKTLRRYSGPIDLRRFDPTTWITNPDNCWDVAAAIDGARHYPLLTTAQARTLRRRDAMERRAGKLTEFRPPNARAAKRY